MYAQRFFGNVGGADRHVPDYTGSGRVQQNGLSRRLNAELAEHAEKSLQFISAASAASAFNVIY